MIYSFSLYYVTGNMLSTKNTTVNKTGLALKELQPSEGGWLSKRKHLNILISHTPPLKETPLYFPPLCLSKYV